MQETFLRLCRGARTYEPRTAFKTWLYRLRRMWPGTKCAGGSIP